MMDHPLDVELGWRDTIVMQTFSASSPLLLKPNRVRGQTKMCAARSVSIRGYRIQSSTPCVIRSIRIVLLDCNANIQPEHQLWVTPETEVTLSKTMYPRFDLETSGFLVLTAAQTIGWPPSCIRSVPSSPAPSIVSNAGTTCDFEYTGPSVGDEIEGILGENDEGVVCCPLECGQCGGPGCGKAGDGNKACCVNGVLQNQPHCMVEGAAPCVFDRFSGERLLWIIGYIIQHPFQMLLARFSRELSVSGAKPMVGLSEKSTARLTLIQIYFPLIAMCA